MINNISLQPLRNGAYIQFLTDTLHIVSKNNPKANLKKIASCYRTVSLLSVRNGRAGADLIINLVESKCKAFNS